MPIDILISSIGAALFLITASGWFYAVGLPQSRFSHFWYGKKWSQRFAAEQKRHTTIRGILYGSGYLLLGLNAALMAFRASDPAFRALVSAAEWPLLGIAALCMIGAAIDTLRHV
jgi:hypothetical protein